MTKRSTTKKQRSKKANPKPRTETVENRARREVKKTVRELATSVAGERAASKYSGKVAKVVVDVAKTETERAAPAGLAGLVRTIWQTRIARK